MYTIVVFLVSLPFIHGICNYSSEWFNENHPWDSHSSGNDIERYSLIRAKYPSKFEINQWTGLFEIREATNQQIIDNNTILTEKYTQIYDGFICHGIDRRRCLDYEIRFCLEYNPCSVSSYPPDEKRIVGGSEARAHSLPWHVSIQFEERHICAGILIDDQHILTAAHCFQLSLFPIQYTIVLGAHRLSDSNQRIAVNRLIYHSDYNDRTLDNDIGLMRLNERIQSYSDRITPACLARSVRQPYVSNPLIVAGWGATQNPTSSPVSFTDELRQTILTVRSECSRVYKDFNIKKQVCVGAEDYSRDSCDGDSGGGLFQKENDGKDRWILTGIISYGNGCAEKGYPSVYVRVSAYYDWIQKNIEQMNKIK